MNNTNYEHKNTQLPKYAKTAQNYNKLNNTKYRKKQYKIRTKQYNTKAQTKTQYKNNTIQN